METKRPEVAAHEPPEILCHFHKIILHAFSSKIRVGFNCQNKFPILYVCRWFDFY